MRYHYQRPNEYEVKHGTIYKCNHPVYTFCTLYFEKGKGLAVVQQRYSQSNKHTYWRDIDPWLIDEIYSKPGFKLYFQKYSGVCKDGLFPTVTVRQIMWALKMKPLKRKVWETTFDHHPF